MITKKMQRIFPNFYVLGRKFADFVPRASSALITFVTFFAVDFPQLLDVLEKGLKYDINVEQGFKKLLNSLLDSSFLWGYHRIHFH